MKHTAAKKKPKVPSFPQAPSGAAGEILEIVYGSNADVQMVLMQFSRTIDRITFTPEQAEQAAQQLLFRAKMARGEKAN